MPQGHLANVLPETRALALALVAEGRSMAAAKLVRKATGTGSKEAREYVDGLRTEILVRSVPPEVEAATIGLIARGKVIDAAKQVRRDTALGLKDAKEYVDALRAGYRRDDGNALSDRVRAAQDHDTAVALVQAETGMDRGEAERFIAALE